MTRPSDAVVDRICAIADSWRTAGAQILLTDPVLDFYNNEQEAVISLLKSYLLAAVEFQGQVLAKHYCWSHEKETEYTAKLLGELLHKMETASKEADFNEVHKN